MTRQLFLFVFILLISSCKTTKNSRLAASGNTQILIDKNAPSMVWLAAIELQEYWLKLVGEDIAIDYKKSKQASQFLYIGKSQYTRDIADKNRQFIGKGGIILLSVDDGLVLLGDDTPYVPKEPYGKQRRDKEHVLKRWDNITEAVYDNPYTSLFKAYSKDLDIWESDGKGSLQAVYHFLKGNGVRWYMPGPIGEHVPEVSELNLSDYDEEVLPDFALRQLGFYSRRFFNAPKQDILWYLRLGLDNGYNTIGDAMMGHGMVSVISRAEFRREQVSAFALFGSRRDTTSRNRGRPCLSSPSLFKSHVAYVKNVFNTYDIPVLSVMPPDAYSYVCECNLCSGKGTPDRGRQGTISDYVWEYVNRLAVEVKKTHPEKKLSCFAYGAYLLPPEKIEMLESNVLVGVCKTRNTYNDEVRKKRYSDIIREWEKRTDNKLIFWDYYLSNRPRNNKNFGLPVVFPELIKQDLTTYQDRIIGEYVEVYRSFGSDNPLIELAFNHINAFVTADLYWNVDTDVDILMQEYCDNFYGPASEEMKAFFEIAEQEWYELTANDDKAAELNRLLDAAFAKVDDRFIYASRLKLIDKYLFSQY